MRRFIKDQNTEETAIFEKVWQNGVIVFDTNVLLNLYKYNKEARNELIKLMKECQGDRSVASEINNSEILHNPN